MAEIPPASTALDPTFPPSSQQQSHTPRPLNPSSFTGMVNNSPEGVTNRYRYNAVSTQGGTNAPSPNTTNKNSNLYDRRLQANLELSQDPNHGYNAWNKKRQDAITRGEDPNSELLDKIEARVPDSYLESGWRKLMGKGRTNREERERRAAKEAKKGDKVQGKQMGRDQERQHEGTPEVHAGVSYARDDDGVIR